jgi:hypothetical protein
MSSHDEDDGVNWIRQNNFNPFDYQASSTARGVTDPTFSSSASFSQPISFRKMQMQQVFSELLDAAGSYKTSTISSNIGDEDDEDVLQCILMENKDVVLEPLDTDDAFLDADSVIRQGMTRPERYQVYLASLQTRIDAAKSRQVKAVLEAIRDFVQQNE